MDYFRNLGILIPIASYYFVESLVIAIFINIIWKYIILPKTGIDFTYIQWVFIIWAIKIVLFDVFKFLMGFGISQHMQEHQNQNTNNVEE